MCAQVLEIYVNKICTMANYSIEFSNGVMDGERITKTHRRAHTVMKNDRKHYGHLAMRVQEAHGTDTQIMDVYRNSSVALVRRAQQIDRCVNDSMVKTSETKVL